MTEEVFTTTPMAPLPAQASSSESYGQLVWRRFTRSKPAVIGGFIVLFLALLAIFAEFFAPYPLKMTNARNAFIPPTRVHFFDEAGNFHLRPFVYPYEVEVDLVTFLPKWTEDTSERYPIQFFVRGWEYQFLGFIPLDIHFFGVEGTDIYLLGTDKLGADLWSKACEAGRISLTMSVFGAIISVFIGAIVGVYSGYRGGLFDTVTQRFVEFITAFPQLALWLSLAAIIPRTWDPFRVFLVMALIFALLSWTTLAREVRGKVLSLRETDFVLAAKEMGASDRRIVFLHLLPNTLSHIIVVLTLTIPGIILAEAFLSFLGIGIQRPMVSWGLLMQDAQNLRTLGQTPWIMAPAAFIIAAVLGFNLLGDGLRDAADPYATL